MRKQTIVFTILVLIGGLFLFGGSIQAEELEQPESEIMKDTNDLRFFNLSDLDNHIEKNILPDDFQGRVSLVAGDIDGDKIDELVVAYGGIKGAELKIFNHRGQELDSWQPFGEKFFGELALAVGDLNLDGKAEIVVAPKYGGGPQIKIYDNEGHELFGSGFFAYGESYRNGLKLATGDIDGDGNKDILVSLILDGRAVIRVYNRYAEEIISPIHLELSDAFEPVNVSCLDLGYDRIEEIAVGLGVGNEPWVKILRKDGSLIKEFLVYDRGFQGGVNLQALKYKNLRMIVTMPGYGGGPHIRFFNTYGDPIIRPDFFAYDRDFTGGVNLALGQFDDDYGLELVSLPEKINVSPDKAWYKYIEIDLSEQKLAYFASDRKVEEFIISSGKRGMDTPVGNYKVLNKSERAYSDEYELYMPFWMGFRTDGYGLHELPEWPGGYKEGANHLGQPVSHGCVRLGVGAAEKLYRWSPIGTLINIHE